jgi:hypothetical protein
MERRRRGRRIFQLNDAGGGRTGRVGWVGMRHFGLLVLMVLQQKRMLCLL